MTRGCHAVKMSDPVELPPWPAGTVAILVTNSVGPTRPHAIPVSAVLRAGPARALLGLSRRRESLARLRGDPEVTLAITCEGRCFSADGRATVVAEELVEGVVGVAVDVEAVHDHMRETFAITGGVAWGWTDERAAAADREVHAALRRLADG